MTYPLETNTILRDDSHPMPEQGSQHAGPVHDTPVPSYGERRVRPVGLAVTLLLHLLLLALYLFRSEEEKTGAPPAGSEITYIQALPKLPKRQEVQTKTVKPVKRPRQEVVLIERLKDTITLPDEKPVAPTPPQPEAPAPEKIDPADDMAARIAARQKARGQDSRQQQGETEAERGNRLARENIERANGKSRGEDEDTTVRPTIESANHAYLEFKGYNPDKRRVTWERVEVDLGGYKDIQTASVRKMMGLLRQGGRDEVEWTSARLHKKITLSVRQQDAAALETFLYQELFPGYLRGN